MTAGAGGRRRERSGGRSGRRRRNSASRRGGDCAGPDGRSADASAGEAEKPHFHGHRDRLRRRFLEAGAAALADYELIELVLFNAIPQRDVKPLAKTLIEKFGSFAETIAAAPERLAEVKGVKDRAIAEFKIVEAAAQRFARGAVRKRLPMGSWSEVLDYCRTSMAFEPREIFRILFLDKKNGLIADEIQGRAPSTIRRSIRAR